MVSRIRVPNTFGPLDDAVDHAWDGLRSDPVANRVFYAASEAANFSMIWHVLGIAKAVATGDVRSAIRTSAALGAESAIVNGPIKSIFERERPDVDASERPHRLRQPRTSSFPSGHASAAVVAASFLGEGLSRRWRLPLHGLAAIVSTSRIHVRIHHATDVAAGAAVGWGLARLLRPVLRSVID
ncbi:MAG: phosphatase PAP2 family protein [Acidimicrobiales bacterium]